MSLSTVCPNCSKRTTIEKNQAGTVIQCPACRLPFLTPQSEEDSLELAPIHDARKVPPPKPVAQADSKSASAAVSPGSPAVVPAVRVVSPGQQDLSELLNDKILKEIKKGEGTDGPEEKRKRRKRVAWMTPEAAGYLKLGGIAMLLLLLLVGSVVVYQSGIIQLPAVPGQGPNFALSNPRSTRKGRTITISIDYANRGGNLGAGEKLMWVLKGPSSLLELDITSTVKSSGSMSRDFLASNDSPITGFECRFEIHKGGLTKVVSNVSKVP